MNTRKAKRKPAAKPTRKGAGGRPRKYKPEYSDIVRRLCLLHQGATDQDIAEVLGVTDRTVYRWKQSEPEFRQALKEGKQGADMAVAESLYQRATGYSHPEDKIFCVTDEDGDGGKTHRIVRAQTIRHYPPDTGSMVLWLKNRAGWKDRSEVNVEVEFSLNDAEVALGLAKASAEKHQVPRG